MRRWSSAAVVLALSLAACGGARAPAVSTADPRDYLVACSGEGSEGRRQAQELIEELRGADVVTGVSVQHDGVQYGVLVEFAPGSAEPRVRAALSRAAAGEAVADVRSC